MRLLSLGKLALLACSLAVVSCGTNAELSIPPDGITDAGSDVSVTTDSGKFDDNAGGGCKPLGCADQGIECGPAPDGCGGLIECGTCPHPQTCGGGGEPSRCGGGSDCVPKTCADFGPNACGPIADGCGGLLECGGCVAPETCGGGGTPSVCGRTDLCTPRTCADIGANACGPHGDGCGNLIQCGSCTFPELCGGDPDQPGRCAIPPMPDGGVDAGYGCVPKTCDDYGPATCGQQGDGCGGVLECGTCTGAEVCGGDPTLPGQCAVPPSTCVPTTCAALGAECGPVGDGCGGILNCGGCPAGQQCGGPGQPSQCVPISQCTPKSCDDYSDSTCGQQSDGCGGIIDCGSCTGPGEVCGGDPARPGECGVPPSQCVPTTCAALGVECGPAGDGCGGILDCGTCPAGERCGGPGQPSQCVEPPCTPRSCAELGFECGFAPDGCGGSQNCWPDPDNPQCPNAYEACIGSPARCESGPGGGCTGPLCGNLPACGSNPTQLSGRVTSPNGSLRVPNAVVYIPRDPSAQLPAISTGPSCDRCEDEDLGPVLAAAVTDHRGEFTLRGDIPVGAAFNIVVKSGKWRGVRRIDAGVVTGCASNDVGDTYTRLPAHKTDGLAGTHLPHVAIATGSADAMECVFYKMGVAEAEFTNRHGDGRIHLYRANGARLRMPNPQPCSRPNRSQCSAPACQVSQAACQSSPCSGNGNPNRCNWEPFIEASVDASELAPRFDDYDMVVWDCEGGTRDRSATNHTRLRNFVNAGGRFFTSDFGVDWIKDNGALDGVANWRSRGSTNSDRLYASFGRPQANVTRLRTFARWLQAEGAAVVGFSGSDPNFAYMNDVVDPRDYVTSVRAGSDEWLFRTTNGTERTSPGSGWPPGSDVSTQTFSFNTPFGASAANICGRVTYSGFHVAGGTSSAYFPTHCSGTLTNQEKVLAYMLFDLAACVSEGEPPQPPACTALTPAQACAGGLCGAVADGCGGIIDCGGCPAGMECSTNNVCTPPCIPLTCDDFPGTCGQHSDGCGGLTESCGTCTLPETCGGAGVPNQCGVPACVPRTCDALGADCGQQSDGCGGVIDCGTCQAPLTCGGGGVPDQCGGTPCVAVTCQDIGAGCGQHGDGCGGTLDCGDCTLPETCGGGGTPNQCGLPPCSPVSCSDQGISCGPAGDGCGGVLDCGDCTWPETCGGGGIPGQCGMPDGGTCEPISCADQGIGCGPAGDGCGNLIDCGDCTLPETCGGGGVPGQCGQPPCTPKTCEELGIGCGPAGDGCGNLIECGDCTPPESCGGGGIPGQCGQPPCTPRTCDEQGVECGPLSDGCGGLLDCGTCTPPLSCGGGGVPGKCGMIR